MNFAHLTRGETIYQIYIYIKEEGKKIILLNRVRILNLEYLKLYVVLKMCKIFDALRNFKTLKAS